MLATTPIAVYRSQWLRCHRLSFVTARAQGWRIRVPLDVWLYFWVPSVFLQSCTGWDSATGRVLLQVTVQMFTNAIQKPPGCPRHHCPVAPQKYTDCLLTPWSRALLEKLTGSAASQEIPRIFGTRRFITVLTSVRHLFLSWASSFQSPHAADNGKVKRKRYIRSKIINSYQRRSGPGNQNMAIFNLTQRLSDYTDRTSCNIKKKKCYILEI